MCRTVPVPNSADDDDEYATSVNLMAMNLMSFYAPTGKCFKTCHVF